MSNKPTSNKSGLNKPTSYKSGSNNSGSHKPTPHKSTSSRPAPKKATPNKSIASEPHSDKSAPSKYKSTSNKSAFNKPKFNKAKVTKPLPDKAGSRTQAAKVAPNKAVPNQPAATQPIASQPTPSQPAKPPKPYQEPLTSRGLERRLKRHLVKEAQEYFAICTPGFEKVTEEELKRLEAVKVVSVETGGVTFQGNLDALYHANLHLRTAHRVLLRIDNFLAQSYPMLFNKVEKIPWELYLGFNKTYTIEVSAKESRLHHPKNISKTIHDGITEYMQPLGLSPKLSDTAPLEIHVRFFQDRCTISVNTSGEHLHKRGYRQLMSEAPIRETLAASILQTVDVGAFETVIDPMCGSGTLLIEAALLLKNIAPGLQRRFAFEQLPFFQTSKWERFKREAAEKQRESSVKLLGFDIDTKNTEIAKANAVKAGVAEMINFRVADAKTLTVPIRQKALIIANVPYGERLESTVLTPFAKNLQKNFGGCHFAFVTKDRGWLKPFSTQTVQRFQNGGLNVLLVTGQV